MDLAIFLSVFHESLAHARASLDSLHQTLPPRWPGPVVVVDHTADADFGFLGALPRPGWRMVRSPDRNAAASSVASSALCFLNAGVILLPGWLPPMLRLLQTAPRAGCVGNVHREPYSGLLDHAGIGFGADGLPVAVARDTALLPRETSDRRAAVSVACCLVHRGVFERASGFDGRFHGPLGGIDFCLRAAEMGCRHYVSNRSVVYRYDDDVPLTDDPDLPLYLERWGRRARLSHARRDNLRREPPGAPFSQERQEMARETRRLLRLEAAETRGAGLRYLVKHWRRPWRYNHGRISRALGQALAPLPPPILLLPGHPEDIARPDDGWLFDPPPQR